jgi:hypothetical protein
MVSERLMQLTLQQREEGRNLAAVARESGRSSKRRRR